MPSSNKWKGVLYILCAAFFFSAMGMFVRLAGDLPTFEKAFFRNLVACLIAAISLTGSARREGFHAFLPKKGNLKWLLLRSGFGFAGILFNFYAIDRLPLSDASMLNLMSPFFAVLASWLLLRQVLRLPQGLAVLGAFAGSLFIIKPTFSNADLFASVVGALGGLGAGVAYTFVNKLGGLGENKQLIVFFFSGFSCLVCLPPMLMDWQPMSASQFWILMGAGAAAAGGQFTITQAYCHAPAREISVYQYVQVMFSALWGFVLFGQIPDRLSFVGYVIIIGMAVLMFLYNNQLAFFRPKSAKN